MDDSQESRQRKTLSFTHKQAGFSALTISALTAALVGPLSQVFQTKLDAAKVTTTQEVQAGQILELKTLITASKQDIIDKINDSMKGVVSNVDKHETRIVNLEFILMSKTKGN